MDICLDRRCFTRNLDQLMDRDVITCDVDLGVREMADSDIVLNKHTPSHNSDSGISDIRSVSPTTSMSDYEPELFDLGPYGGEMLGVTAISDIPCINDNSDGEVNELLTLNSDEAFSPDVNVDEEHDENELFPTKRHSLSSDSTDMDFHCKTLPFHSQNFISNTCKKEEIRILNKNELVGSSKIQTVKVVKVIKTPADASQIETEMRVFEAIEERNKKNAFQAKVNRERKKAYISGLEEEVKSLKTENAALRDRSKKILAEKSALEEEVDYLKSVLANQSALAGLLKNISTGSVNIKLKTSFTHKKRCAEHDHSYENSKRRCAAQKKAGVCLHVDEDIVSLEFCSQCARSAKNR